jgi:hypothetical protein
MPRSVVNRASFPAGQLDEAVRRDPSKVIYAAGLAQATNFRILNGGGAQRRAGTWLRAILANEKAVGGEYTAPDGSVFILIFSNTQLDVYGLTGTLFQTVTGCAWGSSIIDEMQFARADDDLIVTHTTFWPQAISVAGNTFAAADFVFDDAPGAGKAQPYYRYAPKGITLQVDDTAGSINLTTSAAVFDAGHVDTIFRYLGCEITIDGVTNSTTATGTVLDILPSTVTVDVADGTGYLENDEVEGLDSGAKGIITNVSGDTLTVVYKKGLTGFTASETLVTSTGAQSTITSGPTPTAEAAVLDWDEQAFSFVRGYPGGCAVHRGRLYFCNMRDLPRGITASAAGFPKNFLIGANDGDAFFELVPNYLGQRVRHVISASQGIVLTDKKAYFLPEYGTQVITPSTIDFREIAPIGASVVKPTPTEQGFAYVEEGTNRVIGVLPSGNVQSPWECDDISAYWTEMITGPRGLGSDIALTGRAERYAYAINNDGSVACVKYGAPNAQVPIGWTPWFSPNGAFRSIFSAGGKLFAIVQRAVDDDTDDRWCLEEFDEALYMDCVSTFVGAASVLADYASTTVDVISDEWWWRGEFDLDATGALGADFDLDDGTYLAGYDFPTAFEPTVPVPDHPAFKHGQRIGIPRVYVHVDGAGAYYLNNQLSPAYRTGEDLGAAPPLRTEARRMKVPGRRSDLAPVITQRFPGPLPIRALTMEVSF